MRDVDIAHRPPHGKGLDNHRLGDHLDGLHQPLLLLRRHGRPRGTDTRTTTGGGWAVMSKTAEVADVAPGIAAVKLQFEPVPLVPTMLNVAEPLPFKGTDRFVKLAPQPLFGVSVTVPERVMKMPCAVICTALTVNGAITLPVWVECGSLVNTRIGGGTVTLKFADAAPVVAPAADGMKWQPEPAPVGTTLLNVAVVPENVASRPVNVDPQLLGVRYAVVPVNALDAVTTIGGVMALPDCVSVGWVVTASVGGGATFPDTVMVFDTKSIATPVVSRIRNEHIDGGAGCDTLRPGKDHAPETALEVTVCGPSSVQPPVGVTVNTCAPGGMIVPAIGGVIAAPLRVSVGCWVNARTGIGGAVAVTMKDCEMMTSAMPGFES